MPPLENDNTIVITAADAKSTSFGCAPESDWTYFGDAFFRQSLHPGSDFENSFNHARILIQGWELMDRLQPSNPQGHFGPAVVAKLAPYFATNGSAVAHRAAASVTPRRVAGPRLSAKPTARDRAGNGRTAPTN